MQHVRTGRTAHTVSTRLPTHLRARVPTDESKPDYSSLRPSVRTSPCLSTKLKLPTRRLRRTARQGGARTHQQRAISHTQRRQGPQQVRQLGWGESVEASGVGSGRCSGAHAKAALAHACKGRGKGGDGLRAWAMRVCMLEWACHTGVYVCVCKNCTEGFGNHGGLRG